MTAVALASWLRGMWVRLHGRLVPSGVKLHDLNCVDLLAYAYDQLMAGVQSVDDQNRVEAWLRGKLGPGGGYIVDDPDMPVSMQGIEAPKWWVPDDDPFANQMKVP